MTENIGNMSTKVEEKILINMKPNTYHVNDSYLRNETFHSPIQITPEKKRHEYTVRVYDSK